jgi:hypothetical protein
VPASIGLCLLSSTEASVVNVNFAAGATGTAEGSGVNNKLGTEPGLIVGVAVLEMMRVGDAVSVLVEVGAGLGVLVFVDGMIGAAVGVATFAMAVGCGEFNRLMPTTMLRIKTTVPTRNQRRARLKASVRM